MAINGSLKVFKDNAFIITTFVFVIGLGYRFLALENNYGKHVEAEAVQNNQITNAEKRVGSIENDIQWIKDSLKRNESMQQEILRELRR